MINAVWYPCGVFFEVQSDPVSSGISDFAHARSSILHIKVCWKRLTIRGLCLGKCWVRAGVDPASNVRGGDFSNIWIQFEHRFTTERELSRFHNTAVKKTVDGKMSLYRECCFPNRTKSWWIKLLSYSEKWNNWETITGQKFRLTPGPALNCRIRLDRDLKTGSSSTLLRDARERAFANKEYAGSCCVNRNTFTWA